jgi:hypothetical protein
MPVSTHISPLTMPPVARIAIFGSRFALRRTSTFATTEIGRMNF